MCDQLARRIHGDGIAVEHKLIVAAYDIAVTDWPLIGPRQRAYHLVADRRFMQTKWRGAQVDDDLRALLDQATHRFDIVKRSGEIMFRPDIFANGHADFFAMDFKRFDAAGWLEITIFIENVVGR